MCGVTGKGTSVCQLGKGIYTPHVESMSTCWSVLITVQGGTFIVHDDLPDSRVPR